MLLGLNKAFEGGFPGGAMATVAGLFHHPRHQLLVGIGEIPEVTQRCEVILDIFYARFNTPLFLWIGHWARTDQEAIALGAFRIGTLYLRIVVAGFGDSISFATVCTRRISYPDPGWFRRY